MKVILLQNVDKIGKKDEIVDVADGYAKNFLIKKKLATAYSAGSLQSLQQRQAKVQSEHESKIFEANLLKKQLETKTYEFHLKTNNGKSFGSISVKELLNTIHNDYQDINKYMIIGEHKWDVGNHVVKLRLYDNVIAEIKIKVIGD